MILAWQLPTLEEMPMPARFALFCLIPGPCCKTAGKSDDKSDISRIGNDHLLRSTASSDTIYPFTPDHGIFWNRSDWRGWKQSE